MWLLGKSKVFEKTSSIQKTHQSNKSITSFFILSFTITTNIKYLIYCWFLLFNNFFNWYLTTYLINILIFFSDSSLVNFIYTIRLYIMYWILSYKTHSCLSLKPLIHLDCLLFQFVSYLPSWGNLLS